MCIRDRRTAVRQGAKSVVCLYRRDRANMPGSQREVANAEEEGVTFEWLSAPKSISAKGVRAIKMRLGAPDASGRQAPEEVEGSEYTLEADIVIKALGFSPEDAEGLFGDQDLRVSQRGTLDVDTTTLETSLEGVYAAGDIVRGASLVVWAIRDGRVAAEAIAARLRAQQTASNQALAAAE